MRFLNIGSGTGYLSSIVGHILGPTGVCYGVELSRQAYDHGLEAVHRWKAENDDIAMPPMDFVHGNGLNIDTTTGEAFHGFDRIYVGATIERSKLSELALMLRFGGIIVGPGTILLLFSTAFADDIANPHLSFFQTFSFQSGRRVIASHSGS
jgi:protein-L-isoaspartate O-methyltransferase